MTPIKVILHPTDLSPCSAGALALASSLARDNQARLILLYVRERPLMTYSGVVMPPPPEPDDDERKALREKFEQLNVPGAGLNVERKFEEGDPATAILQVAAESKADMIIMGTHGRTGLRRLLMGSVAEKVLRKASCPVVTYRSPGDLSA